MTTSRSFALAKILKGGSKVSNDFTSASSNNTANAIVSRDASGNFSAGAISAALSGNATTATTLQNARTIAISGDVTGSATSFNGSANITISAGITAGSIVDADINASAAIADTKLATIATAGKVSNSATTATNANTASAIVSRDASGNFTAGTITAALSGNATSATTATSATSATTAGTVTTAAQPNITSVGTLTSLTSSGTVSGLELTSTQSSGDEGGQVNLAKPATNNTIAGTGVVIDIYQNRLRFFEQGSPNRGGYIDITAAGSGIGSNLLGSSTPGDGTLTLAVSGTGLSGSASFTANQSSGSTFTVTSNATSANTAGAIVARDASGNFTAGVITASQVVSSNNGTGQNFQIGDDAWIGDINQANTFRVSGAQDATQGYIVFGNSNTTALGRSGTGSLTYGGSAVILASDTGTVTSTMIANNTIVSGDFNSATSLIIYNSAGTAVKTVYSPGS